VASRGAPFVFGRRRASRATTSSRAASSTDWACPARNWEVDGLRRGSPDFSWELDRFAPSTNPHGGRSRCSVLLDGNRGRALVLTEGRFVAGERLRGSTRLAASR